MNTIMKIIGSMAMALILALPAAAHHGWSWTEESWFELTGTVTDVYVGQPHATLSIEDAEGQAWDVDLAPLSSTLAAGFSEDAVEIGAEVTLIGHRSADAAQFAMKAVRVVVGDMRYDVYPDRAADYDAESGNG